MQAKMEHHPAPIAATTVTPGGVYTTTTAGGQQFTVHNGLYRSNYTTTGNENIGTQNSITTINADNFSGRVNAVVDSKEGLGSFEQVYMPAKKPVVKLNSRMMLSST